MYDTNVCATKAVLGAASALGIGNLLYVSSVIALFHPGACTCRRVDNARRPFRRVLAFKARQRSIRSRATAAESSGAGHIAGCRHRAGRSQAERGQPRTGVACRADAAPQHDCGFQCVDVRDLAQAHVWLLEHPADREFESARYTIGGHFYPWDELRGRLEALLGRRIFSPRVPPRLMRFMGATADRVKKLVPFETQISAESMSRRRPMVARGFEPLFLTRSGLCFRSGDETFGDTIRWLVEAGSVPHKRAGRLVTTSTVPVIGRHGAP